MKNPITGVKKLKENDPRWRVLTPKQWSVLSKELCGDQYLHDVVTIGMNFPLRRRQVLSIKRKDVDLVNRVLWAVESKGKPPRPHFINDAALGTLTRLVSEYSGELFPMKYFQKRWQRLLERAGINQKGGTRKDNFHFHDLRTHLGTSMILGGVSPRVVQKTFNHSNMTTSAIYMAVGFEQQKEALRTAGATYLATNVLDETAKTQ